MERLRAVLKCPKCGSDEVVVEKYIKCGSKEDLEEKLLKEILCHDGYGWDLNTFSIRCARCGSKIEKVSLDSEDTVREIEDRINSLSNDQLCELFSKFFMESLECIKQKDYAKAGIMLRLACFLIWRRAERL